jgi:outer membrane protein OmpA-like peptidoglycan-associated protein
LNLLNKNQTGDFDENSLEWITMNIYHDLLNIIGSRLKKNPGSTITITGCNNNLTPNELNNQKLSIDRANSVRDYLIGVWGIDPPRIKIRRLNLPPNPGNINIQEGIEENQRAEISSDNFEIVKPVFLKKIDRQANPPSVTIVPYSKADAGVEKISIQVMQGANELREFNEEIVPDSVIWLVETEPMPSTNEDINIGLTVWDNEGQKCESKDKLNITQKTIQIKRQEQSGDKIIQKYSLILFNYDKSELTPGHISILEKIRKEIKPDSKVEITGYADRTGLSDYNRELARKRAEESKKQLFVEGADYTIIPIGSDELIYNNDTPQGRSYCRTVKIKIETPVK